jgi:tetratricopeptide (TPR) repeat protein
MTTTPLTEDSTASTLRAAIALLSGGHQEEGVRLLQGLLDVVPDNADAHFLLGAEFAELGLWDQAEAAFKRTVELAPTLAPARLQWGLVYFVNGQLDAARDIFQPLTQGDDAALALYGEGLVRACDNHLEAAARSLRLGLAEPQAIPVLASDMARLAGEFESKAAAGADPLAARAFLNAHNQQH